MQTSANLMLFPARGRTGTVRQIASLPVGRPLSIAPDASCFSAAEAALGDSICICGCCLTVVSIHDGMLDFEAGTENSVKDQSRSPVCPAHLRVNLERSAACRRALGGHIVQGHVDGVAKVTKIDRNGDWVDMWFAPAPEQLSTAGHEGVCGH
ncbi:MAG: hypothetical protein U0936_17525 [Planctomycetaceae bacterium]